MSDKPVQHGYYEKSSKVLVSLEDFTSLRGEELLQRLYLVVIGYNLDMQKTSDWILETWPIKKEVDAATEHFKNNESIYIKGDPTDNLLTIHDKDTTIDDFECKIINNIKTNLLERHEASVEITQNIIARTRVQITEHFITSAKNTIMKKLLHRDEKCNNNPQFEVGPFPNTTKINIPFKPAQNDFGSRSYKTIYTNRLDDFFFAWRSKEMMVQKGRLHQCLDGYPLFYGSPNRQASIYVAVLENNGQNNITQLNTEEHSGDLQAALKSFQEIHYELSNVLNEERKKIVYLTKREKKISENFDTIKKAFSLLIKTFETAAVKEGHQIRYTNVFTFKENDEWLEGGHQDWGDHRMAMTIKVEVSK